jgi:hypothetical protein
VEKLDLGKPEEVKAYCEERLEEDPTDTKVRKLYLSTIVSALDDYEYKSHLRTSYIQLYANQTRRPHISNIFELEVTATSSS